MRGRISRNRDDCTSRVDSRTEWRKTMARRANPIEPTIKAPLSRRDRGRTGWGSERLGEPQVAQRLAAREFGCNLGQSFSPKVRPQMMQNRLPSGEELRQ